jgi:hypothetical protein
MEKTTKPLKPRSFWVSQRDLECNDVIIARWARQTGKTSNLLMLVADYCREHRDKSIVIVSHNMHTGTYIMERLRDLLEVKRASHDEITTTNGNAIRLKTLNRLAGMIWENETPDLSLFDEYAFHSAPDFKTTAAAWEERVVNERAAYRAELRRQSIMSSNPLLKIWERLSRYWRKPIPEPPHRSWVMWTSNGRDSLAQSIIEGIARDMGYTVKESTVPIQSVIKEMGYVPSDLEEIQRMLGDETFIREYADYDKPFTQQNGSY